MSGANLVLGGLIGTLIGAFFGPVGALVGLIIGLFIGAYFWEENTDHKRIRELEQRVNELEENKKDE